jgi:hypothetical protein
VQALHPSDAFAMLPTGEHAWSFMAPTDDVVAPQWAIPAPAVPKPTRRIAAGIVLRMPLLLPITLDLMAARERAFERGRL